MSGLRRLGRRISNAIAIGRQTADTDESKVTQQLQIALPGGELRSGVPAAQLYGICARPVAGADHVVIFIEGDRSRGVSIGSNDQRCRPKNLQPGEVALYDRTGSLVVLKQDGSIAITPSNGKVAITAAVSVMGSIMCTGDVTANGISLEQHLHGGVQGGSAQTGKPQG